ncbi:hypothetical protein NPIL_702131 [Nephila pilipes]|uniref:Uncharacterized protein n=1 Tax=Nephila pilipes TaxID=299642 RepID=A0A8X6NUZ6_NEPPI|nr:hypothetical protein NPIL_696381 [Nephila pilipes]GFT63582.1 hypothetical protein NPIL_702131 [Nephila pilipes]
MGLHRGLRKGYGVGEQPRRPTYGLSGNTRAAPNAVSAPVIRNVPFQVKRTNPANRKVNFPGDVKENSSLYVTLTPPAPKKSSPPANS